jgi:hypothetical protein
LAQLHGLIQRVALRNTTGEIGKANSETGLIVRMNKSNIIHTLLLLYPTSLSINRLNCSCFDVFIWVGNRNTPSFFWMFKLMVTALFHKQNPTLCLKLLDQFSAIMFHQMPLSIHTTIHTKIWKNEFRETNRPQI